jgi:hypothetical protein
MPESLLSDKKVSKIAWALQTYLVGSFVAGTCVIHIFGAPPGGRGGVSCLLYATLFCEDL